MVGTNEGELPQVRLLLVSPVCSATNRMRRRIASPEMLLWPRALPHVKCSPGRSLWEHWNEKVSMTARDELVNALARRYAVGGRAEKTRILDEFVAITGFHRKHGMRLLRCDAAARRSEAKASRRIYDEAVREAIVVLWEASDRICGKRLKALMPTLVEAMERHGHLRLGAEIRAAVLAMSAATIDRSLREVREPGKRQEAPSTAAHRRFAAAFRCALSRTGTTAAGVRRGRPGCALRPGGERELRADAYCHRHRHGMDRVRAVLYREQTCSERCLARSAGCCPSSCWALTRTTTACS